MKDEIRTFAEYRTLVKEYKESDSVSRREAIKGAVYDKAKALLKQVISLHAKYGRDFVENSAFLEGGCGELSLTGFDESKVLLRYSDYCAYNGDYHFEIKVQMKYLDNDEMVALEKELHEKHMSEIKRLIQEKKEAIEQLKREVKELEVEEKNR